MVDEQKLRQLAEAATPIETELYGDRYFQGPYAQADLTKEQDDFVTAAHPAAILSLLDELQALRAERTAWRVTAENAEASVKQARIDALEEAKRLCIERAKASESARMNTKRVHASEVYGAAESRAMWLAEAIESLKGTP